MKILQMIDISLFPFAVLQNFSLKAKFFLNKFCLQLQ